MDKLAGQNKKSFSVLALSVKWPAETFILQTLKAVAQRGICVQLGVVATPGQKIPADSDIKILKLPAWDSPITFRLWHLVCGFLRASKSPVRLFHLLKISGNLKTFYRLLPFVNVKADLLHFQWNSSAIEYELLPDFLNCPVVISCRGSQIHVAPHNPARVSIRESLRQTFTKAVRVHCVSDQLKKEAIEWGLEPGKAHVIHPGVDTHFFSPSEIAHPNFPEFRIVTAGNLVWVKGHEYALLAMRKLLDHDVKTVFKIIGSGPDRQRILFAIHDLELEHQVELCGALPKGKVLEHFHHADVFLLSSLSEGISNAALEAMSCGLPVVVTDCGGMKEAVSDGEDGFVVPVRDAAAMAEKLSQLAKDAGLRQRMGKAARKKITNEFTLEHQTNQFLELYAAFCHPPA